MKVHLEKARIKIPIIDHRGNQVGHCGPRAGAAVAARLLGNRNVTLGKKNGKPAWIGSKPNA